jgi:hypothetical protein
MASIYQRRNNGLWIAAWYVNGKKKEKAFKDKQRAEAYLRELPSVFTPTMPLTLGELTALFFKSKRDYHPTTKCVIVKAMTDKGVAGFLREKYAELLNRQDLEQVREACRVLGMSNVTINKHQAYIRAILAWGAD